MERYEKYKPSGIEWIGEIPEYWHVKMLKRVSPIKRGASPRPIDNPIYFDNDGEFGWVRIADVTASERYLEATTQNLSELGTSLSVKRYPNDFILSIAGSVGKPIIVKIKCCVHDGFVYFPQLKINPEYLYYIFSTGLPYQGLGKQGTQLNLNTDTVGEIYIPIPDNSDIERIINYLDKNCKVIDALIERKERLLELYAEKRQAIINRAVTRGIDPNAPLKDSGIPYLGQIPQHWEVKKIGYSFKVIGSGTTPEAGNPEFYHEGTVNWINTGDLNDSILTECTKQITETALEKFSSLKIYPKGTLLIAMYGATIGKVAIMDIEACTNQACCALADSALLNHIYMFYWFISNKQNIINLSYGGGQPNISQEIIRQLRVTCPPIEEQADIVKYIEEKCGKIDQICEKLRQQIDLYREYRTALIANAVTGKIKI